MDDKLRLRFNKHSSNFQILKIWQNPSQITFHTFTRSIFAIPQSSPSLSNCPLCKTSIFARKWLIMINQPPYPRDLTLNIGNPISAANEIFIVIELGRNLDSRRTLTLGSNKVAKSHCLSIDCQSHRLSLSGKLPLQVSFYLSLPLSKLFFQFLFQLQPPHSPTVTIVCSLSVVFYHHFSPESLNFAN